MDEKMMRILLIENSPAIAHRVKQYLRESEGATFDLQHADQLTAAMARLDEDDVDVVLLGLSLPDSQGLDALERLQQYTLDTPVIVLAASDDEALALEALAAGAQDYLFIEQVDANVLVRSVRYALERHRDLRERSWAEEALRKVNRALDVLSESNQALVRATAESELVQDLCDIIVRRGGYACAWIGYARGDEARPVEPVAHAGKDASPLIELATSRADAEDRHCPALAAIRNGRPAFALNVADDPDPASWRQQARKHGIGSIVALPLLTNDNTIGALTIYASQPNAFDVAEIKLLQELAEDVAYGIDTLRVRARQREAEKQLAESRRRLQGREAYYRALIENTTDIVTVVGQDGVIRDETPSVEKVLGYTPEEMVGNSILNFVHPDDVFRVRSFLSLADGAPGFTDAVQFRLRHKDGSWLYLEAVGNDLIDEPAVGGIVINSRDVTGRQRAEEALRRSNERLTVLREVEQAILSARSPEETAKAALSRMRGLIPYDRASVTLFDLDAGEARMLAMDGRPIPAIDATTRWSLDDFGDLEYIRQGRHYLVDDLREGSVNSPTDELLAQAGLRTLLHVPLLTSQKFLGSLNMTAAPSGAFDHNHVQIAYEVAGSLAIAIQNAQLLQEAQQQAAQLAGLYDTALNITSALDKDALLNRLAAQLQEMLSPDAIGVVLYDRPTGEVEVALARENGEPVAGIAGRRLPLTEAGLSGWVIRQKRSLLVRDMNADPLPETPRHSSRPAISWLGVPLLGREQTLGAMSVQSLRANAFGEEDARLLESMAAQVAIALQNVQLYEQTHRRAQELEALEKVSSALRAARHRDEMFDAILDSLHELLHLESAGVLLRDPATAEWNVPVVVGRHHHLEGSRWSGVRGLTSRILEADELFVTPNLAQEPEFGVISGDALSGDYAAACFPLSVDEELSGAVWLTRAEPFTSADVRLLGAVGDMAANAIRRAGLYQRTLEHAREVEQIIETVPDGMLVLDRENRIVLANPAARAYLPLMTQAAVGDELIRLGDRPLEQFLAPQGTVRRELKLADPQLIFEILCRPIAAGPQAGGAVLMIHDITEEQKRQQYLQAQERLATVGQLAAGIAHDFNNIMAIITLYSQSLERDPDFPKRRQYLNTISKQARHAASLIGQILDFSRASVMERSRLDLIPFVKEVKKLLERTLPETIVIDLDAEPGDYSVKADPTRLQQVLMNLAVNARDAMPGGGHLQLALSRRTVQNGQRAPLPGMMPGKWIELKVSDSGAGIPPSNLSHIFEPFFTTKERGKGTGLGLAQVYGIVKQHGGEISVHSKVGEGATFTIFLPALSTETARSRDEEKDTSVAGDGQLVLLVEDDAGTRQAMADILEMLNYRVRVAGDGAEGLAIFEEQAGEIALVISDMVMPEMGGMRLYRRLKGIQPDVRVILMTGYPLEEEDRELLEAGMATWIQKPFTPEQIGRAIRDGLR